MKEKNKNIKMGQLFLFNVAKTMGISSYTRFFFTYFLFFSKIVFVIFSSDEKH